MNVGRGDGGGGEDEVEGEGEKVTIVPWSLGGEWGMGEKLIWD